jgi:hypothetical protein
MKYRHLILAHGIFSLASLISAATPGKDTTWLQEKGTLIFHDTFDREEDGNLAKAIGRLVVERVREVQSIPGHLGCRKTSETGVVCFSSRYMYYRPRHRDV